MANIIGQYLCGRNYHDHIDVVDNWFAHSDTAVDLIIKANKNGYAWGIR
jgi:hypothetical protein